MTTDHLTPTPARIELLRDAANGLLVPGAHNSIVRDERLAAFYDPLTGTRASVTSHARALEQAGWIRLCGDKFQLTDRGRDVLDAAAF